MHDDLGGQGSGVGGRGSGARHAPADPARPSRARHSGIVLPVCLSLLFSLLLLALALAQQSRAHLGFALLVESETRERDGAFAALAQMCSILQYSADPALFASDLDPAVLGLPVPLPTPPLAAEFAFNTGYAGGVRIRGQFGGSASDSSLYLPPPSSFDPAADDGYEGGATTNGGIKVPARHSAIYVDASVVGQPRSTFLGMFSANYPYGLFAATGTVEVGSAFSVGRYSGRNDDESGIMANLYGTGGVKVAGASNVRVYGPITSLETGPRGLRAGSPRLAIPRDFEAALRTALDTMSQGTQDKGLDLLRLQQARHELFAGVGELPTIMGVEGTDLVGSTFQVAGAHLVVQPRTYLKIPYDMDVQNGLVLMDESVLVVTGSLRVRGNLYLGRRVSLVVGGATTVDGRVDMIYRPNAAEAPNVSLCASILSSGEVLLKQGMRSYEGIQITSRSPFSALPCPEIPLLDCNDFNERAIRNATDLNTQLGPIFPALEGFLGAPSTDDVPGIFVHSERGIQLQGGSAVKYAGLFVAEGNITTDGGRVVGAMWTRVGAIAARDTAYRCFPYWTHAYVHTRNGDVAVNATRYWRTGFGRVVVQQQ